MRGVVLGANFFIVNSLLIVRLVDDKIMVFATISEPVVLGRKAKGGELK